MTLFNKSRNHPGKRVAAGILLALLVPVAGTIMTDAPAIWPLSVLIYNLGLVYSFALAPGRTIRIAVFNILAAALFLIEASFFFSFYLQNTGFNEAFFYHLRADLLSAGVTEYLPVLLSIVASLLVFLVVSSSVLARGQVKTRFAPFALSLLVLGLFISPPVKALVLYGESLATEGTDSALFENFPDLRDSQPTAEFTGSQRPNIVLIYAESLEQRYFDETVFPGLLPNLKALRQESIDFSNISQGVGAGWTIAGIVASQCGYPLAGAHGVDGNNFSVFDEFMPKATCLGDLLEEDGYRLTYMGGADARFAGKGDFLRSHGYDQVLDLNVLLESLSDQSYRTGWGLFDDSLFELAYRKFTDLSAGESPFLLTLLTLDTHMEGNPSGSCGTYGAGDNVNLNAVHCTDRLISGFIDQIRNSPFSGNTLVIVVSDHLAMRNSSTPLLGASGKRDRLTFFVNMPDGRKEEITHPGIHYDIAPTILDLAGYSLEGGMGFGAPLTRGAGYLPGRFGEKGWEAQSAALMAIGRSLWDNEVRLDGEGIRFTASDLAMSMGGRKFDLRSRGYSEVPAATLFVFDEKSLELEKIQSYPLNEGLSPGTFSRELLKNNEKLVLAISHAGNLPGFSDPQSDLFQWVFFCGRPGSAFSSWGPITGDFTIPFDLIRKLSRSTSDDRIVRERENLVDAFVEQYSASQASIR